MIGLIILGVLAVLFVVLLWARSGQPGNEGASLGHNSPYPDSVMGPSPLRPRLGTPESLVSHRGVDWEDEELQREELHHHRSDG